MVYQNIFVTYLVVKVLSLWEDGSEWNQGNQWPLALKESVSNHIGL